MFYCLCISLFYQLIFVNKLKKEKRKRKFFFCIRFLKSILFFLWKEKKKEKCFIRKFPCILRVFAPFLRNIFLWILFFIYLMNFSEDSIRCLFSFFWKKDVNIVIRSLLGASFTGFHSLFSNFLSYFHEDFLCFFVFFGIEKWGKIISLIFCGNSAGNACGTRNWGMWGSVCDFTIEITYTNFW